MNVGWGNEQLLRILQEPWGQEVFERTIFGGPQGDCWLFGRHHRSAPQFRRVPCRGSIAARVVLELFSGPPPRPNALALHSLGHTAEWNHCINPSHLRWGTYEENVADCRADGTLAQGTAHAAKFYGRRAKLTPDQVLEIREARASGVLLADLAAHYGVQVSTISRVANGVRQGWVGVSS